jgi:hypothetical protein
VSTGLGECHGYTAAEAYVTNVVGPLDFTMADGPLPNSYLVTPPANTIPQFTLLPINSGNTFVIQVYNDKSATGVCQKI